MMEILIELWKFVDAPDNLRSLFPLAYTDGWLALIHAGGGEEMAQALIDRWSISGYSLARRQLENGGIVLAGQDLMHSATKRFVQ